MPVDGDKRRHEDRESDFRPKRDLAVTNRDSHASALVEDLPWRSNPRRIPLYHSGLTGQQHATSSMSIRWAAVPRMITSIGPPFTKIYGRLCGRGSTILR